ncbi:Asp-tRNA(Asn)/Glu-tRNA(Gln) amidotransferase subunit GatB, partial [Candidatus Saccharibacteria bacterium]|nr:Asp-tRNA(Asn)/Glu-tRNA(Gln) amidotransferase subunit GatB [Candidatus Saccharibacteria bacterium]
AKQLGKRAEIKNLNSFRSVERAVEYEYARQSKLLGKGEPVRQETRGWNDATGKTTFQRSKEEAQDYRYMPEPDIPPINLSQEFIDAELENVPLLPRDYRAKFKGVIADDTLEVLLDYPQLMEKLGEVATGDTFGKAPGATRSVSEHGDGKENVAGPVAIATISNLFASVLLAEEKSAEMLNDLPTAKQLDDLCKMKDKGELSSTAVKEVFLRFFDPQMKTKDARTIAKELNLIQENDTGAIEKIVDEVIADPACAQAIADFKAGSEKVIGFLVGQVMKKSQGKANPASAQQILRQKLA